MAYAFLSAFADYLGEQKLTARHLTRLGEVGQDRARLILRGELAMPLALYKEILSRVPGKAPRLPLDIRYLEAYSAVLRDDPAVEMLRRSTIQSGQSPGIARRLSTLAIDEANVTIDTGARGEHFRIQLADLYVRRHAEQSVIDRCGQRLITCVVGEPGTGKTSLLWALAHRLRSASVLTLMVRASDLIADATGAAVLTVGDLRAEVAAIRQEGSEPVLLVDTLDLLLRDGSVPLTVAELLETAAIERVGTVVTCRVREAQTLAGLQRRLPMEHRTLDRYSDTELPVAMRRYAAYFYRDTEVSPQEVVSALLDAVARGLPVLEICQHPLFMRMMFELADGGLPDPELDTVSLYDRHWQLRVAEDRRHGSGGKAEDLSRPTMNVATVMLALSRPQLVLRDLEASLDRYATGTRVDSLAQRSLIEIGDKERTRFFHQTFFEYAAGRAIWALGVPATTELITRTIIHYDDLFLAAVTHRAIVYATATPAGALDLDAQLAPLFASPHAYTQELALSSYAQSRSPGEQTRLAARRALATADADLVKSYLRYVPTARHARVSEVLDDLHVVWRRPEAHLKIRVLEVLRRLAALDPHAVLTFADEEDCFGWVTGNDGPVLQNHGNPALQLIPHLVVADAFWASERLRLILTAVACKVDTRDGLARVIVAAAVHLPDPELIEDLIRLLPEVGPKDRGVSYLERATALAYIRIWDMRASTANELVGQIMTWSGERSSLLVRAQLIALSEMLAAQTESVAVALLRRLLTVAKPALQTDICEHVLRRLVQGEHRPALPGGKESAQTPVTHATRTLMLEKLRFLPAASDPSGARAVPVLCRDALDFANLPPETAAELFTTFSLKGQSKAMWTDPRLLACLVVPVALGGHPGAARALDEWCASPADRGLAGKIISYRLRQHLATHPAAVGYLLDEAMSTKDVSLLKTAIQDADPAHLAALRSHRDALSEAIELASASEMQAPRLAAEQLRAELTGVVLPPPAAADLAAKLRAQTQPNLTHALLALVLNAVERDPAHWSTPDSHERCSSHSAKWRLAKAHTPIPCGRGRSKRCGSWSAAAGRCRFALNAR